MSEQKIEHRDMKEPGEVRVEAPEHGQSMPEPDKEQHSEETPDEDLSTAEQPAGDDKEEELSSSVDAQHVNDPTETEEPESDNNSQAALDMEETEDAEETEEEEERETAQADVPDLDEEGLRKLKTKLEVALFASVDPLSINQLCRALGELPAKHVREAITWLQADYAQDTHGLQILEVAGGYQMATKPEHSDIIEAISRRQKKQSLSPATLETLAIIAYKQPIIRAEIESIRGVDSGGIIRNLIDMGLVAIVGKKDVIGYPPLYGTTKDFLKMFGLKNIHDLPSIQDLREMMNKK